MLRTLPLMLLALPALAQPPKPPVVQFPAFGGVTQTQVVNSNVIILTSQVLHELAGVKAEVERGRIPPPQKTGILQRLDQALRDGDTLRKLASGNAELRQLRVADAAMDRSLAAAEAMLNRYAASAPAAMEAMARAEFAEQQLHQALHGGGVDVPIDRVRRQASFLEQQADVLRNHCDDANDGTPAAIALERAARGLVYRAKSFDRAAEGTTMPRFLTEDFAKVLETWRGFSAAYSQVQPPVALRLQATRVENTLRNLADMIPPPAGGWDWVAPGGGWGFLGRGAFVVGAGSGGGPRVRLFANRQGDATYDFFAYDLAFIGGVRVAVADLTGDGVPDLVTAPGPGMPALVRVFDGRTMRLLVEFHAFDPQWTGGAFVAAADRTRDGRSWVAVSADTGAGPHVKVFDLSQGKEIDGFFAYDERFRGGCRVALGDVNGDGMPDVLTVPGPGLEPRVKVFDGRNRAVMGDFLAFDRSYVGGLSIAAADVTKNGRADLIVGTDAGQPAVVRIFDAIKGKQIGELQPFPRGFRGGVRVSAYDFDVNGTPDVACAPGRDPNHAALPIRVFSGVNAKPLGEFFPFGNEFRGGAFLGSR